MKSFCAIALLGLAAATNHTNGTNGTNSTTKSTLLAVGAKCALSKDCAAPETVCCIKSQIAKQTTTICGMKSTVEAANTGAELVGGSVMCTNGVYTQVSAAVIAAAAYLYM